MQSHDLCTLFAHNKMAASRKRRLLKLIQEEEHMFLEMIVISNAAKKKKRTHKYWIHPILLNRKTLGTYHSLVQELKLHGDKFRQYFRVSTEQFENLLTITGPHLTKYGPSRETISASQRLAICLR